MVNPNIFAYESLQQGAEFINRMAQMRGITIERETYDGLIVYTLVGSSTDTFCAKDNGCITDKTLQEHIAEHMNKHIPITGTLE